MNKQFFLASVLLAVPAFAEPTVVAHVGIIDGAHESQLAVAVPQNGQPSELSVSGPVSTKVRLRKAELGIEFDVEQIGADHTSFRARGEVPTPPMGKRVVLARIPRAAGGNAEVQLTLR
jgi:hypothetical protein